MKWWERIKTGWLGLSEKSRSIFYLVPLFVFFLPGLLLEKGRPRTAAVRSFCLAMLFLLSAFLLMIAHFYIWKQTHDLRYFRDLVFFLTHLVLVIGYLGLSGYLIYSEVRDEPPESFFLDRASRKLVRFLEFKA